MKPLEKDDLRSEVLQRYSEIAQSTPEDCGCSPNSCCDQPESLEIDSTTFAVSYSQSDLDSIPAGADMQLGCGNPIALADLQAGETVLDLGSGGGIDCFLAAKAVGEKGFVIGVDMTPAMVRKARAYAQEHSYKNVSFRLGEIEHLPVADASVDAVISNCVINLSPEKAQVLKDAYRVLKPGGRLIVADIVTDGPLPDSVRSNLSLYTSCVAGATSIESYEQMLTGAGFTKIQIQPAAQGNVEIQLQDPAQPAGCTITSAMIRAEKPMV
jgi:SAM-dependent methyltransferase